MDGVSTVIYVAGACVFLAGLWIGYRFGVLVERVRWNMFWKEKEALRARPQERMTP